MTISKLALLIGLLILSGCQSTTDYATQDDKGLTEVRGTQAESSQMISTLLLETSNEKVKTLRSNYPQYPVKAQEMGIEGRVIVEFIVDKTGKVEKASILQSAGELLDKASLEAVLKWRFIPILEDGEPTEVTFRESFVFKIDDQDKLRKKTN
jgi:TonB family protein